MFFGKDRKLYKCHMYTWATSLETALVTGSLLFVAHGCHLTNLSAGEFVMRVSHVSANLFLCGVRRVPWTVLWDHRMAEMAMGSDCPAVSRSGVDFQVQLQVSWNAPEAYVNLNSDGTYELKTVPDVLGLHAQQPGAVIKVLLGHDSRSVRALVPDVKVRDRGFHDVTLMDMGDIAGPDISIADFVSPPFAVASTCQRWNSCAMSAKSVIAALRPTRVPFVGRGLSCACPDTSPTITWKSRSYGAARCRCVPYGRVRHRIVWTTYVWHTQCRHP